jgi:glycosyltransferase involved in cell wall biosynthesis
MLIERILSWRESFMSKKNQRIDRTVATGKTYNKAERRLFLEKIVRWANSLAFILGTTCYLARNRRDIDVIHVHIADWIAGYAGWLGSWLSIPVVCKAADMPALPKMDSSIPFSGSWERWRKRIRYVAMHDGIADELERGYVPRSQIVLIPNGVELPVDQADPSFGNFVLFVGNFTQGAGHKGFDILFKAWAKVNRQLKDVKLIVAGQGERCVWENMLKESGCSQSVQLRGYVHDMDRLYRDAALFVLPSRHEGMSNALLEAQAWGVPAVVSDIPGNRAVIDDGVNGMIVPVGDYHALADAICHLLSDSQLRKAMGAKARQRVTDHFSMERVAAAYVSFYTKISGAHRTTLNDERR